MSYIGKILDFEHFIEDNKNGYIIITSDDEIVISCEGDKVTVSDDVSTDAVMGRTLLGVFVNDLCDNIEELSDEVCKFVGTLKSLCLRSNKGDIHFKVGDNKTLLNVVFRDRVA